MKKIFSAACAAVLMGNLLSGAVVNAEEPAMWICTRVGDINTDKTVYYAEQTNDYKFSGDASLMVKYPGLPVDDNYLEIKEQISDNLTDGT